MAHIQSKHGHTLTCDVCGTHSPTRHTLTEVCKAADYRGWDFTGRDLCPTHAAEATEATREAVEAVLARMEADGTLDKIRREFS